MRAGVNVAATFLTIVHDFEHCNHIGVGFLNFFVASFCFFPFTMFDFH